MAKKRQVLFVDDDRAFLDALARHLRNEAFHAVFEDSGEAALLRLHGDDFDVVVLDNRMPGMGGVELAGEIARTWPGIVIIMLSGHYEAADLMRAINDAHVYRALSKPCTARDLRIAVIVALKHKIELERLYKSTSADDYFPHDPRGV